MVVCSLGTTKCQKIGSTFINVWSQSHTNKYLSKTLIGGKQSDHIFWVFLICKMFFLSLEA